MHELIQGWKIEVIAGVEWRVSPGVPWCAAGFRVRIAASARIGVGARIGEGASIGEGARIGMNATFIADLGSFEGYRKVICSLEGIAYIGAGCRWFTLAEAKKHWNARKPDRAITHAMLSVATVISKQHKLREIVKKEKRRGK